jgi:NAD(P)-dependent dehydrogenase (short-subunit alcohol dehydrogenase family)
MPGNEPSSAKDIKHMRLLVLGGTRFVGRAVVDRALAAGAEVTLFNRGGPLPGCIRSSKR